MNVPDFFMCVPLSPSQILVHHLKRTACAWFPCISFLRWEEETLSQTVKAVVTLTMATQPPETHLGNAGGIFSATWLRSILPDSSVATAQHLRPQDVSSGWCLLV